MENFKEYRRIKNLEMRETTKKDIVKFNNHGFIRISEYPFGSNIAISDADIMKGSPKIRLTFPLHR